MKRLGISLYPKRGELEKAKEYLALAGQYGFSRVFTCLISADPAIIGEMKDLIAYGNSLGFHTIADVSPEVFKAYGVSYKDLSFFKALGLWGIRLDMGFSGYEESLMTYNPYDLKIEINMSNGTKYLDNILSYQPNIENLIGCHNFYPHRYTGLSREHFLKTSRNFKEKGITTAAFVSSQYGNIGPWQVEEGLCTLEEHRNLRITTQAKDLYNTGLIDDVIIANAYASEGELKALQELDKNCLTLEVIPVENLPSLEEKILFEEFHFNRGDVSSFMIRSTQSRVKYKGHSFPLFNPKEIKRGDILIESDLYDRYAGELQIALKDMENSGKTNVVARIKEEELFLLDEIRPWQPFAFKRAEGKKDDK